MEDTFPALDVTSNKGVESVEGVEGIEDVEGVEGVEGVGGVEDGEGGECGVGGEGSAVGEGGNEMKVLDGITDDEAEEVTIVLHQPEEMGVEEEEEEIIAPDNCTTPSHAGQLSSASKQAAAPPSSGAPNSLGGGSSISANYTPHKMWVNPKLQQQFDEAGTPQSVGTPAPLVPSRAAAPAVSAAQKAKLGPLVHVPGGLEMDLSGKMADNMDLDSLPDKPWLQPGADPTDYFNYGFNEDTWRLYCQKQQAYMRMHMHTHAHTRAHAYTHAYSHAQELTAAHDPSYCL
mgnify:CR=1 FL=1